MSTEKHCGSCGRADCEMPNEVAKLREEVIGCTAWIPPATELLEGLRVERREPTAAEQALIERRRLEAQMDAINELNSPVLAAIKAQTDTTDKAIHKLLDERYPGTPLEAFYRSFIPDGFRLTAPDGVVFDFVYTSHRSTTEGAGIMMTTELNVIERRPAVEAHNPAHRRMLTPEQFDACWYDSSGEEAER